MCDDNKYIIKFECVSYRDENELVPALSDVDLGVKKGELVLILLEKHNTGLPLCDLAQGLLAPGPGRVLFQGEDWQDMDPGRQSAMRGRTGRVFHGRGWVSNLNVYENTMLASMYHGSRSEKELLEAGLRIAERAGLNSIPAVRPETLRADQLKRYEWVRAFLADPVLLLLQSPETGVRDEHVAGLTMLVEEALETGCAVIWTTTDPSLLREKTPGRASRYSMRDDQMILISED